MKRFMDNTFDKIQLSCMYNYQEKPLQNIHNFFMETTFPYVAIIK